MDVQQLQQYREGNRLEFKRAKGGLPNSFWETYSSFANTEGGLIVLGADEGADGLPIPTGIGNPEAMVKDLWNGLNNPQKASANILVDSDVEVMDYEGRQLLLVHVPRADRHLRPVFVNNNPKTGTYRRNGEGDYHVTNDAYLSLVRDSMVDSVDTVLLEEFSLDDLHDETVQAYRNAFRSTRPDHPWVSLPDLPFLMRIGAVGRSERDHRFHPTRAGLLMFGEAWRIVSEFPQYFLDCRQVLDDGNRWSNRIVSSSGEWTGNVYDFWHRASRMLTEGLPVPFRLGPDMRRIDDTPQHRAVREALTNALVHADYFGRTGVVLIRKPDRIIASNPGTLRIPLEEVEAGGVSDPRNRTLLSMFSLLDIGERAGSGYDVLREGAYSAGKPDPVLEELWEPDRVRLTLQLETNGMIEFRLPGMGGERSPLVTEVEPPRKSRFDIATERVSGQVDGEADQVTDQNNVGNVGNDVGNVGNNVGNDDGVKGPLSATEQEVLNQMKINRRLTAKEIAAMLDISDRQVERARKKLREAGIIERVGGTRGYWKIKE